MNSDVDSDDDVTPMRQGAAQKGKHRGRLHMGHATTSEDDATLSTLVLLAEETLAVSKKSERHESNMLRMHYAVFAAFLVLALIVGITARNTNDDLEIIRPVLRSFAQSYKEKYATYTDEILEGTADGALVLHDLLQRVDVPQFAAEVVNITTLFKFAINEFLTVGISLRPNEKAIDQPTP